MPHQKPQTPARIRWSLALTLAIIVGVGSATGQTLTYVADGPTLTYELGRTLAAAGDLDGDGTPELAVGCPDPIFGSGDVRVLSLADGSLVRTLHGEASTSQFGAAIDASGDLDGDGVNDLLVGAPLLDVGTSFDNRGRAYAYSGATGALLFSMTGAAPFDNLGQAVVILGDVNADGVADLAVGAPGANVLTGRVTVHSGAGGSVIRTLNGEGSGDQFGASLDVAGDVDGDGVVDLLIGAPRQSAGGNAGRVYIVSGATGATIRTFDGLQPNEHLGTTVAGVGDLDGDGIRDVVLGAPDHDGAATDSGIARAYSSATGALLWSIGGPFVYSKAGMGIDSAGDLDADGVDDVLVGMPYIPP